MKAFKLMMMAGLLAFAGSAMAQEKKVIFSAEDVTIAKGEEAVLTVNMDYETSEVLVGWNMSLYLPEGIAVKTYYNEDDECDYFVVNGKGEGFVNSNAAANAIEGNSTPKQDGGYLFIGIGPKKQEMKATDGAYKGKVVEITLVASEDVVDGDGKFNTISISNSKNESVELNNIADVSFKINPSGGTDGINEIQTSSTEAPAYNLQGIRVNNAKGLIIRDGKNVKNNSMGCKRRNK